MQFGIVASSALASEKAMSSKQAFDYVMTTCRVAQESGFEAIGLSHRYLAGPEHQFLQPLVMASHIMTEFPEMYVGTNVLLLSYENPIAVAEQVATLDMISPGKFLFGVGQGYRRDELRAFGVARGELGHRMTECIKAMRLLWRNGACNFDGEFWQFDNAHIGVKPVNKQGPPIIMAADKLRSVALVPSRGGDHWLPSARHSKTFLREAVPVYRQALEREGKSLKGLALIRDICVAENKRAAEALIEQSFTNYLHLQHVWGQPGERYDLDFDQLKHDRVILGTSEDAAQELVELHQEFRTEFVTFRVYTPGMDPERALDVIRQIGTEVLPAVRKECGRGSLFEQSTESTLSGLTQKNGTLK